MQQVGGQGHKAPQGGERPRRDISGGTKSGSAGSGGGGDEAFGDEAFGHEEEEQSWIEPVYATRIAIHPAPMDERAEAGAGCAATTALQTKSTATLQAAQSSSRCPAACLRRTAFLILSHPLCLSPWPEPLCLNHRRLPKRTLPAHIAKALVEDMPQMDFNPRWVGGLGEREGGSVVFRLCRQAGRAVRKARSSPHPLLLQAEPLYICEHVDGAAGGRAHAEGGCGLVGASGVEQTRRGGRTAEYQQHVMCVSVCLPVSPAPPAVPTPRPARRIHCRRWRSTCLMQAAAPRPPNLPAHPPIHPAPPSFKAMAVNLADAVQYPSAAEMEKR